MVGKDATDSPFLLTATTTNEYSVPGTNDLISALFNCDGAIVVLNPPGMDVTT